MLLTAYFYGLGAGTSLIVAIGAQNAFVLRQGLLRRYVADVVFVCALADACLILAGVAGMGAAVQERPGLLNVLRYAGAVFLFVYGVMAAHRAWRGEQGLLPDDRAPDARRRVWLACLGFTLLNPHVYLDTVVLLGSLSTRYPGALRWLFAAGACTASVCWFTALGWGARVLLPVFRDARAWRMLDTFVALLMFALATLLLLRPLR
ncbi:MAG TPA: LysE/ArgO family amino acid transporter [Dyella sp.]|uniref:LysE/ArgO family amino acid transporter n=1 Tax=Dyella sp. TaxID=1869338 RepID=UPI002F947759